MNIFHRLYLSRGEITNLNIPLNFTLNLTSYCTDKFKIKHIRIDLDVQIFMCIVMGNLLKSKNSQHILKESVQSQFKI